MTFAESVTRSLTVYLNLSVDHSLFFMTCCLPFVRTLARLDFILGHINTSNTNNTLQTATLQAMTDSSNWQTFFVEEMKASLKTINIDIELESRGLNLNIAKQTFLSITFVIFGLLLSYYFHRLSHFYSFFKQFLCKLNCFLDVVVGFYCVVNLDTMWYY